MPRDDMKLLQGTLDVMILKALSEGPRHGYSVAEWIRRRTDGELQIEEGALYTALHRMQRRKWLSSEWGVSENNRKAKFYRLTARGEEAVREAEKAWVRYSAAMSKVLALETGD